MPVNPTAQAIWDEFNKRIDEHIATLEQIPTLSELRQLLINERVQEAQFAKLVIKHVIGDQQVAELLAGVHAGEGGAAISHRPPGNDNDCTIENDSIKATLPGDKR